MFIEATSFIGPIQLDKTVTIGRANCIIDYDYLLDHIKTFNEKLGKNHRMYSEFDPTLLVMFENKLTYFGSFYFTNSDGMISATSEKLKSDKITWNCHISNYLELEFEDFVDGICLRSEIGKDLSTHKSLSATITITN